MMRCPDHLELQSYVDQELGSWQARSLQQHVECCPECRHKVSEISQVKSLFSKAYAGDAFSVTVSSRINTFFRRRLAVAAAVIVLLVAISGFWSKFSQPDFSAPEAELVQEYLEIHCESGS